MYMRIDDYIKKVEKEYKKLGGGYVGVTTLDNAKDWVRKNIDTSIKEGDKVLKITIELLQDIKNSELYIDVLTEETKVKSYYLSICGLSNGDMVFPSMLSALGSSRKVYDNINSDTYAIKGLGVYKEDINEKVYYNKHVITKHILIKEDSSKEIVKLGYKTVFKDNQNVRALNYQSIEEILNEFEVELLVTGKLGVIKGLKEITGVIGYGEKVSVLDTGDIYVQRESIIKCLVNEDNINNEESIVENYYKEDNIVTIVINGEHIKVKQYSIYDINEETVNKGWLDVENSVVIGEQYSVSDTKGKGVKTDQEYLKDYKEYIRNKIKKLDKEKMELSKLNNRIVID